jgi:hypothetical protein
VPERHGPVAETLPDTLRVQLEDMRALAGPYLDRIVAELEANPTTVLDRLPAVLDALAVDDTELRRALVAATMERHLDSSDEMWQALRVIFSTRGIGRDGSAGGSSVDDVVVALAEVSAERSAQELRKRLEPPAAQDDAAWPRPLPPGLDERLHRHRFAAEPWLRRVQGRSDSIADAQEAWREAADEAEPLERHQQLVDAAVRDAKGVAPAVKQQPADLQVSVALASLYEILRDASSSSYYLGRLWSELNRRALPYEADDLELGLALLDGHEYGWFYGERLVRAIARFSAGGGAVPERWHDHLRPMLAFAAGSRSAKYQQMAVTIRSLLGTGGAGGEEARRLDVSIFDGADAWSTTVRAILSEEHGDDAGLGQLLRMLQHSGTAPRPSTTWRRDIAAALAASASSVAVVRMLLETAIGVRDALVRRTADGSWLYSALGEPAALQIRAAAWAAQLSGAAWAPELLERLAGLYTEMLFNGEPYNARVVNGAVSALALRSDRDAVVRLARLQRSMWHGGMRKHVERELDSVAAAGGLTRGQLLELSAPDLGLERDGTATLEVGAGGSLTLSLDERCRLVAGWSFAGRDATTASPPAALRSAEPDRVKELQHHVKQARASLAVERDRVDGLLAEQPRWNMQDWAASYERHPVLRVFGRSLIWNVELGDQIRAGIAVGEAASFVAVDGDTFTATDDARVTLWHPIAAEEGASAAWRSALFERRLVQPVRQAFREVYRLAPEERGSRHYSTRFAGYLLRHQPLRGLFKRRGWRSPGLYVWDAGGPDVAVASRAFAGFGIRAELRYRPEWTEEALDGIPGAYQLVGTDQLRFYREGKKEADALALEDVPALVVSEAMRDLDLFVSVCSVALDPAWRDVGDEQLRHRWREHAFGELVESARIRRDVLAYVLPELSIADRCKVYDRDLVVDGRRATYRIHIGTGQVRVDPHGSPLVIPERRVGGRELADLFLPVEADDTLTAVLNTAFLLANDDAVTDPAFLSQLL